jgi:hypothetical protein
MKYWVHHESSIVWQTTDNINETSNNTDEIYEIDKLCFNTLIIRDGYKDRSEI